VKNLHARLTKILRWGILFCLLLLAASTSTVTDGSDRRALLAKVRSWGCQYQNLRTTEIAASKLDLIVIEPVIDGATGRMISTPELTRMQMKAGGERRLVLAYLSIGEAAQYRSYWKAWWQNEPPPWLGAENPNWPMAHAVRYWYPEWKEILFGRPNSVLDEILAVGFDGVFIDRVDVFRDWISERPSATQDMVDLVDQIGRYARSRKRKFLLMAQNAETMLTERRYTAAIDAVSKESLLFGLAGEGIENKPDQVAWSLHYLAHAHDATLPVFAIEYLTSEPQLSAARRTLAQLGYVPFFASRLLDRLP
jgi:cysteinyl-tRNA synthetase, unknown class